MKRLIMTMYRFRDGLSEDDLRKLTKKFLETGTTSGVIAHYARLDGKGGFTVEELPEDEERSFEFTLGYAPWLEFDVFPITTMEEALPVMQRVYS